MGAETLLRFVAAFAVIAGALYVFVLVAKRGTVQPGSFLRRERLVEVIETTPLPHASSLHVVKVVDALFVIGRTDHGIALLSEIPSEAAARIHAARAAQARTGPAWLQLGRRAPSAE